MVRKILDIHITIDGDGTVMLSSGAMQCEFPVRLKDIHRQVEELTNEWLGMTLERSCKLCANAKIWEEDGEPCWECDRYANLGIGGDPVFSQFYQECMRRGYDSEQIGGLCPCYDELEELPKGTRSIQEILNESLPDYLKPQAE